MRTQKSKSEKAPEQKFEIVENGNCFELHKITKDGRQKVFIKAGTNYKDFKEESNKYRV